MSADPDDLDRAVAAGHALFTLSDPDLDLTEREAGLVDAAIKAGVLGAWQADKDAETDAKS